MGCGVEASTPDFDSDGVGSIPATPATRGYCPSSFLM